MKGKSNFLFFSSHSVNSIPMLPLMAEQLTQFFNVEVYHFNVKAYAQLPGSVKEHAFAVFADRASSFNRSRFFNLRRYLWLILQFYKALRSTSETVIYCTDDSSIKVLLLLLRYIKLPAHISIGYHEFEQVDNTNKLFQPGSKLTEKDFSKISFVIAPEVNRLALLMKNLAVSVRLSTVIPNTCYAGELPLVPKFGKFNELPANKKVICHVGSIGTAAHYFNEFIDAIPDDAVLVLVGTVSAAIQQQIDKSRNKDKIYLWGQVNHADLKAIYPYVDWGLILYKGVDANYEFCAPNKLYEFWSWGTPVIAHKLGGLTPLFNSSCQGKLFDFENPGFPTALAECINGFRNESERVALNGLFANSYDIRSFVTKLGTQITQLNLQ